MNLPLIRDFDVMKGDTFTLSFSIKDRVLNVETVRDLTGYTASGMVRETQDASSTLLATMTFSSGSSDLTNGIIILKIADTITGAMTTGTYYYDAYVTNTSSEKLTYLRGKFNLVDRLTT